MEAQRDKVVKELEELRCSINNKMKANGKKMIESFTQTEHDQCNEDNTGDNN